MTNAMNRLGMQRPSVYAIRVEGWITDRWKDWFDGMTIVLEGSMNTQAASTLQGVVADQAALLGVLQKLYDLGFPLLSVERKDSPPDETGPCGPGFQTSCQTQVEPGHPVSG